MRNTTLRLKLAACAVAVFISACGGGDASAPASGGAASIGFAIDGYLNGATVLCDTNGNGVADSGERMVTTDSSGFFRFSPSCTSALVATGGTSIDTGLAFTGTLRAPSGATVITPLTTLIANGGSQSAINTALGLPADTNLLTTDPARTQVGSSALVNADLMKKTLVIQQFAQKITEMIAGLATSGGDAARPAIYNEVMSAIAQTLAANPALISGSTISETSAQALIKAAVQRIAASSLPAGVKAGVAALNPDSLAQVMAGALKIQGETILGASGETLTATTKTAQESTAITTFIQTNKANAGLTGAPTAGTATLATDLKNSLSGNSSACGTTAPTCAPTTVIPSGSTVIYSDAASLAGIDTAPNWGQNPAVVASEVTIANNKSLKYVFGALYQGIDWSGNAQNVSSKGKLHLDFFSSNITSVKVSIVSAGPVEQAYTQAITAGNWNSVDIDLSNYTTPNKSGIIQIKLEPNVAGTLYVDNIYFWGTAGGGSGASTLPITFDSASVSYSFEPFEGASAGEVVADPAGGTNKVGKVVRAAGGPWYGGVTVSTGANRSIATIPFAADAKSMTMRVFSPGAGMRVRMKVENASNAGITSETDAVTVGTGWEVLTFNFNNPGLSPPVTGGPTAELNVAQTYNKVTLFFNVAAANGTWGGTYYFDDIAFVAPANGGGGSSNAGTVTFSSGFAANSLTPQGGLYYAASGSSATDWNCPANSPGICGTGGNFNGAADSSIYTYFQFPTGSAPTGLYVGVSVLAPNVTELSNTGNTAGVTLAGQTKINFKFNQNPEWFNSTTKNFLVMLEMGKRYVVGNNATCRIQLHRVVTPTSADPTNYSINLSDFSVAQNCGTSLNTVAQALADGPVSQVTFQGAGGASSVTRNGLASGANFNVAAGTVIPTTVALAGAITFN